MLYGYLKIAATLLAVPIVALLYAKQVRLEDDIHAVEWDVHHPPNVQWVMDHPRECLQRDRGETRYLHQLLILDLDL